MTVCEGETLVAWLTFGPHKEQSHRARSNLKIRVKDPGKPSPRSGIQKAATASAGWAGLLPAD
jgi:hypothetical protein